MAFADQSLNNQSSILRINVMVVDDDPVFLGVMSRMLEKSKYRDSSIMEITVIAVKDPREALSTLNVQRNNIDLIVTDYYMPNMNGIQLKEQITQEFGNLPVIVMSADTNKKQESLSCGAMCFLPKPIKATELTKIYELALTCKKNGKSILLTEPNHKDTNVSIPQQIQLLPEKDNLMKTKKKKFSPRPDSRSVNTNGSCVSTDASRKRKPNGGSGDDVESLSQPSKKSKIKWTCYLHDLFLQAIQHIGLEKAVPKKILEFMNVPTLTRENIASHLQKYRLFLKKVANKGFPSSNMLPSSGMDSMYPFMIEPYYNNYTPLSRYDTSLNNRSFYSKPGHGLGQSRLLSNTAEPVGFNQMPYNYMNRSSTYGSNLTLPIKSNLNFSSQPSRNEERSSFLKPTVMVNKTSQTSQVLGFGQHGLSATNGNSFNHTLTSYANVNSTQPRMTSHGSLTLNQAGIISYGSSTSAQPRIGIHGSLTPNQLGMNKYGGLTSTQPRMSSHGSLSPSQPRMSSYEILTSNQPRMGSHGSLYPNQPDMSSYGNSTSTNQLGLSSHGSLTLNQSGVNTFGSATHNAGLNNYGSLTPHQPGSSNLSYGLQSFLNNENSAYKPQPQGNANTQPNVEIPQLENFNFYDELDNINELACEISNSQFNHNKQQEVAVSTTQSDLPANLPTEMNQILSLEEDGDWTFGNINQGRYNGETSNNFAPETNSPIFNMSPNHDLEQDVQDFGLPYDRTLFVNINEGHSNGETSNNVAPETNSPAFNLNHNHDQEQDVQSFVDWSLLNPEDLTNEFDFMASLLTSDMMN